MRKTVVNWTNRQGEARRHTLFNASESYARNWWRENILECQGVLSVDEKRTSKLALGKIEIEAGPMVW